MFYWHLCFDRTGDGITLIEPIFIQTMVVESTDLMTHPDHEMHPRRILSITHNPQIPTRGGQKLHEVFGWNDPQDLEGKCIQDVFDCSMGRAQFEVVRRVEVNAFPVKQDGFIYTPEGYLSRWQSRSGFHQPDTVDYLQILKDFEVQSQLDTGFIDEVWLFGFPYAGYYESVMGGPGAFWCNAPALSGTEHWSRKFILMGFNYERGVGEMLEALGHRAESILSKVYRGTSEGKNMWERFTRYDLSHPGRSEVGNVHFAPNSERDYDWGNRRKVLSYCDDWYQFPNFPRQSRWVNCKEWGNGDTRLHHLWWFKHFPHFDGQWNGISQNWWNYVLDPNCVP